MQVFGNAFDRFCWRLKREMKNNHKPILLLFGNGYDSQILLVALLKLKKTFTIVYVAEEHLSQKVSNVLTKAKQKKLILRPHRHNDGYKTFYNGDSICLENLHFGFSRKDYFIICGFKLTEPSLLKAFFRGNFQNLYCPLLRYCDGDVQTLYQDMKDNESIGRFMFENITSDSHHNIAIN